MEDNKINNLCFYDEAAFGVWKIVDNNLVNILDDKIESEIVEGD